MTAYKKALREEVALDEAMPDSFAVRARCAFDQWRNSTIAQGDDAATFNRLAANVGYRLNYAAHATDACDKKRYLYDCHALIMIMTSKIERANLTRRMPQKTTQKENTK